MSGGGATRRRNRLAEATSPYLLQHAENPVDWHEWGEEALKRAKHEDKPILLSIGYSACHWCHVMAHESFEDAEIGARMSRDFVCIKVDREERPDIDDIYMAATLAMNQGQGGWPMTVFLTPDQEPFFAGTYFPPEDRWGRPGFGTLLTRLAEAWRDDRDRIRDQGARLAEHLRDNARAAPGLQIGESEIRGAVATLDRSFDERHGGFGPAPKFPPSVGLSLLLRAWRRFGDERALEMARRTLDAMARGGMYDQLAGGFHRYSVDAEWLVPHFEKMLYDNAQLARIYTDAWAATGEPRYRRIATEILDYVLREMTDPEGGFYSATDADSEGEEGRFFVWTPEQVREGLGDPDAAERFCAFYDVTASGNWEGKSILRTLRQPGEVARALGVTEESLVAELERSRRTLLEVRARRVAPGLDDKVLTAWNGLMLGALAEAARVFGEPRYLEAARRNAEFLHATLRREDGGLLRTWRQGRAQLDAYLEDYAYLAGALVDLYEASGERADLDAALELTERLRRDFAAPEGGFYSVAEGHESLIVRHREGHDGAIPNANASAAHALARLGFHLGRDDLHEVAARALRAWGRAIVQHPRGFCRALEVADLLLEGPVELALVGASDAPDFGALWAELGRHYLPNRIVARSTTGGGATHPLLEGREPVAGRAALYVCRDFVCRRPVTAPGEIAGALSAHRDEAPEAPRTLTPPRTAGAATPEGTAAWAERHRESLPHGYGPLGNTGLTCSRIGFGGDRVDDENAEHREALVQAVLAGVNLIDTVSTYTLGASERLVGEVIADLTRGGAAKREELIVVSKLGFLQGPSLERARERSDAGEPWPELVRLSDTAWYCLHPDFLDDELQQSLDRLRLDRIDLLLLHNPENLLEAGSEAGDRAARRAELERRLEQAFAWAESAVAAGQIGAYGLSSNALASGSDDDRLVPRGSVLRAAERAGGDSHGLRALQVRLNLLEGDPALRRDPGGETLLAWAERHGLAVLVGRPLNAAREGRVIRLADFEVGAVADLDAALEALAGLEDEFLKGLATRLQTGPGLPGPEQLFRWSAELGEIAGQRPGLPQWQQLETVQVHARLLRTLASLDRALEGTSAREWHAWRERYLPPLERALHELDRRARERSREDAAPAARALEACLPANRRRESLSRQALWTTLSVPGVSATLVGMRRREYVADAIEVLRWASLAGAEAVLENLAAEPTRGSGGRVGQADGPDEGAASHS